MAQVPAFQSRRARVPLGRAVQEAPEKRQSVTEGETKAKPESKGKTPPPGVRPKRPAKPRDTPDGTHFPRLRGETKAEWADRIINTWMPEEPRLEEYEESD